MITHDDLHRLVDELDESALPDAARRLADLHQRNRADAAAAAVAELRRRVPWIGPLHSGHGDLTERSTHISS